MKKALYTMALVMLCLALAACSSTSPRIQVEPNHYGPTEDELNTIELPENYSQKNYKRIILAVNFFPQKDKTPQYDLPLNAATSTLETEIAKLKRFTVVSRGAGQRAIDAERRFQNSGRADNTIRMNGGRHNGRGLNANYVLYCGVSAVREQYERIEFDELLYIVRLEYQIIDVETNEIIEADFTEGRALRTISVFPDGTWIGGFNMYEGQEDPIKQATLRALTGLSERLGTKLPIGGQVVAMRGSVVQIDKGRAEGFMGKQRAVLYMQDYGVDVPLALVDIVPGEHTSRGTILCWSDKSEDQDLIYQLQNDPTFIRNNDVFVVSKGMPQPTEWERSYSD